MTNMHHTNPQLMEINQLNQRNAEFRGSNKLLKGIIIGLVLISIWAVFRIHDDKSSSKRY